MTTRKRRTLPDIGREIQTYLFNRDEASTFTKAKDKVKKPIDEFIRANGVVEKDDDGNELTGNIVYRLPEPIQVGSKVYSGMELRKSPQISFDEDAALELAKSKGLTFAVVHTVTVVDQEAFYVLNQQGKITDEELDALLVESDPKYSLWPLEK